MAHPRPIPSLPSSYQNSHLVRVALLFLLATCSRGGWPQPQPNRGRALTGLSNLGGSIPFTTQLKLGCAQSLSLVWLFATPWPVDHQAPLSMGFSWQEYWSGLPFPPPGDLSDPGIKPMSLVAPALAGRFFITDAAWDQFWWMACLANRMSIRGLLMKVLLLL